MQGPMYQGPSNIYLAFPAMDGGGGGGGTPSPPGAAGGSLQQPPGPPPPPPLPPQFSGASPPVSTSGGMVPAAVVEQLQMQYDQFGVPYHPHPHLNPHMPHMYPPLPPLASHHSLGSDGAHPGILTRENSLAYNSECNGAGSATEPSSADSTTPHSPPDLSGYSPSGWTSADQSQLTAQLSGGGGDPSCGGGGGGLVSPPPLSAPSAAGHVANPAAAGPRLRPPLPSRPMYHQRQNFQVRKFQTLLM